MKLDLAFKLSFVELYQDTILPPIKYCDIKTADLIRSEFNILCLFLFEWK